MQHYKVPNYKPSEPPRRNEKELERLRKLKAEDKAEKKRQALQRKREEYWLNNPTYFERPDDSPHNRS